jgi:hypothetical protein
VNEKEFGRANTRLGIALFIVAAVIFAATIGFSYLYLALD